MTAVSTVRAAIARRFRADMAEAAGILGEPVPTLAETLSTLNDMHARVQRMIEASPPRTQRTRAEDREGVA